MNRLYCLTLLTVLTLPVTVLAIDSGPSSPQQQETEGWLVLQSRNQAASKTPQTQSAAEREAAMQRWLKKYQYEIPDLYDPDAGGEIKVNE